MYEVWLNPSRDESFIKIKSECAFELAHEIMKTGITNPIHFYIDNKLIDFRYYMYGWDSFELIWNNGKPEIKIIKWKLNNPHRNHSHVDAYNVSVLV